ncbi:MAG TPA: helix-turn-helix domain-containing protein, partial [Devosia sp.]|nr:helix-turn-helix domain-containing protein [Devosia sp.]
MSIRAVERAIRVLQELNLQPVSTIAHLHSATGLPKPTLVRMLQTLYRLGLVETDARLGGYQITAEVASLSSGFHKTPHVVEAGRAWAIAMTRRHQWPVAIALYDEDAMVVRFSTVPDSNISPFHATINKRLPLLTRGLGLAYLAFVNPDQQDMVLNILSKSD